MNSIDFSHINQVELSKQYLSSASSKDVFQFETLNYTPESFIKYIHTFKGMGKSVLDFILKYRYVIPCLKNKTIADAIGCHPKTVQYWTTRFMNEGILIKSQVNRYAPNHFYLHPRLKKGDISWALTQDRLTPQQKDLYIQIGTIIPVHKLKYSQSETPPHYKYSLPISKYLYSNQSIISLEGQIFAPRITRKKPKPTSAAPGFDMDLFKKKRAEYKALKEKEFWDGMERIFDQKPSNISHNFSDLDHLFPDLPEPTIQFDDFSDLEALFN